MALSERQMLALAAAVYVAVVLVPSLAVLRGGVAGRWLARHARRAACCWLAYGRTRAAALHRPAVVHRHRRPHNPRAAVLAARLTHHHTHGGTR